MSLSSRFWKLACAFAAGASLALGLAAPALAQSTPTTTTLEIAPNPAVNFADAVLSAVVEGAAPISSGTVTYYDGSTVLTTTSVAADNYLSVAAGTDFSCGLTNAGAIQCWGDNRYGQIGDGTTDSRRAPVTIIAKGATAISAGADHACAVVSGSVRCWGRNIQGQIGDGSTTNRTQPVTVINRGATAVAAGGAHSCAVVRGAVQCWGANSDGQAGTSLSATLLTPTTVISSAATKVAAGFDHSCAIVSGAVRCWGSNSNGQAGFGAAAVRVAPGEAIASGATALALGSRFSCAIVGGALRCWGLNNVSQLGDGTTTDRLAPVTIISSGVTALAAGSEHACALVGSTLRCWGKNDVGQIGDGTATNRSTPVTAGATNVVAIAAGDNHTCAARTTGLQCWGDNAGGAVGNGLGGDRLTPEAALSSTVTAVDAGYTHSCAVQNNAVKCWGDNSQGQVGTGAFGGRDPVTTVISFNATAVATGGYHSCAVVAGEVQCWGFNGNGQLGDGTTTRRALPVIPIQSNATAVTAGAQHSCALVSDSVRCWGDNAYGQLGDGTTTDRTAPVTVIASNATAVAAGDYHTCAIVSGAVLCWGRNFFGEVGNGTTTQVNLPVSVIGNNATALGLGSDHSCAVVSGSARCWGRNDSGQVGDGSTTNVTTPTIVVSGGVSRVGAGVAHTCAVIGQSLSCWGINAYGQFGNGTTTDSLSPLTTVFSGVSAFAGGTSHSCAIINSGLQCWGRDNLGQLGLDPTNYRSPQTTAFGRALANAAYRFTTGTKSVSATYNGSSGHTSSSSGTTILSVQATDTQAPVLTVSENITVSTDLGLSTAVVTYDAATATDNVDGAVTPTRTAGLASGAAFPLGTTTVTFTATDAATNQSTASFTVTVVDTEAPVVTVPANILVPTAPGLATAPVTYTTPTALDNVDGLLAPVRTAGLASGSNFPVGTTTLTFAVTDAAGNTGTASFTVTVVDVEAPTLTVPGNIEITTDPGLATAVVTYAAPTATDNVTVSPAISRTAGLASGAAFPVGVTTVTHVAVDAAGNIGIASFTVTVTDDEKPALFVPANITVNTDPGLPTAVVTYADPTALDNVDTGLVPVRDVGLASGSVFPLGVTTITYSVSDAAANETTATFTVTVLDAEAPVVTVPSNITVDAAAGSPFAPVTYAAPTAVDNVDGPLTPTRTAGLASGSNFPLGLTTVTFASTDAAQNTGSASFNVIVRDVTPPTFVQLPNISITTDPGLATAVVTYPAVSVTDDIDGPLTSTRTVGLASGAAFPVGVTTVTHSATDVSGNSSTMSFTVTVVDDEAPVVIWPSDFAVTATGGSTTAPVDYFSPTATDNVDTVVTPVLTTGFASGSAFPLGSTLVTFVTTDVAGNATTVSFTVTVSADVTPGIVTPVLTSTPNPSGFGKTATLTATVAPETWTFDVGRTKLAAGESHSCGIRQGRVLCWGSNTYGQLGDGSGTDQSNPVTVGTIVDAVSVAAGQQHSCAVRANGTVLCWGNNPDGRLGDGTTTPRTTPVAVSGLTGAVEVAAGAFHTCARLRTNSLVCWGGNTSGQIGDGTTITRLTPVAVSNVANALEVVAGQQHSCARRSTGALACWGLNSSGQIGDGTLVNRSSPTIVSGISDAAEVSAGNTHTCTRRTGGTVRCWGYNGYGALGDNTQIDRRTPVAVSNLTGAVEIDVGGGHTCARRSTGAVLCWGRNSNGEIGDGTSNHRYVPTAVATITGATGLVSGYNHSCARLAAGTLACWGRNANGQLGNVDPASAYSPVATAGPSPGGSVIFTDGTTELGEVSLTAGSASLALTTLPFGQRSLKAAYGGDGTYAAADSAIRLHDVVDDIAPVMGTPSNIQVPTDSGLGTATVTYTAPTATDNLDGAITPVRTAGLASGSAFPAGVTTVTYRATDSAGNITAVSFTVTVTDNQQPVITGPSNIQVSVDSGETTAVVTYATPTATDNVDGTVTPSRTAGLASGSAFPIGVTTVSWRAVDAAGNAATFSFTVTVARPTATDFSLVSLTAPVTDTGPARIRALVEGFGPVTGGAVNLADNGTAIGSLTASPDLFSAIAAGADHACAVSAAGALECWGANADSQLGNGTTLSAVRPQTIFNTGATAFAAGSAHSCALVDGAVWCWGVNGDGQVGNGASGTTITEPVKVIASGATAIAVGSAHSCAVVSGALWCWGENSFGQAAGTGTADQLSPVRIVTSGVTAVAAGSGHTCYIASGAVRCFGQNTDGQLGNGTGVNSASPQIAISSGATAIAAGGNTSCAIVSGALNCWGRGGEGQVGDGGTTNRFAPVQVVASGVAAISVGTNHSCAVVNGAARCWGRNSEGQLGAGNETTTLTQVSAIASNVTAIAAGAAHSCAIVEGRAQCWGRNGSGQLADGGRIARATAANILYGRAIATFETTFTAGLHPLTATYAGDGTNDAANTALNLTVADGTVPVVTVPANIALAVNPGVNAVATYTVTATDNVDGALTPVLTAGLASGSTFPTGVTTVTFRATDAAGNSASASFTVTVTLNDVEPPVLTLPSGQTVLTDVGLDTAVVTYSVTATDTRDGTVTPVLTAGLASGSAFPIGSTIVTFSATDVAGNVASGSFTINVLRRGSIGGNGSDTLTGTSGADSMDGGAGDDIINGLGGADTMTGGTGNDTYYVDNAGDRVIELAGQGNDLVYSTVNYTLPGNVEYLTLTGSAGLYGAGNSANNSVTGNAGANRLVGNPGNDVLAGLGGADTIDGGTGEDTATYVASNGGVSVSLATNAGSGNHAAGDRLVAIENLTGSNYADRLTGNDSVNDIEGGNGADIIEGKGGADQLIGGRGADVFVYRKTSDSTASAPDTLYDFRTSEFDRLDLTAIDANTSTKKNDAFTYLGEAAFSGKRGQLRFRSGRLEGDVNGDRKADFVILLKGVTILPIDAIRR